VEREDLCVCFALGCVVDVCGQIERRRVPYHQSTFRWSGVKAWLAEMRGHLVERRDMR
jgi:hypothetical protein